MLKFFFWSKEVRKDHTLYYFQQDNASSHRGNKVQKYLKNRFGDRFIYKKIWHPRSPDSGSIQRWVYLKSRVYNPLPKKLDELKANIVREISNIGNDVLKNVI